MPRVDEQEECRAIRKPLVHCKGKVFFYRLLRWHANDYTYILKELLVASDSLRNRMDLAMTSKFIHVVHFRVSYLLIFVENREIDPSTSK